MQTTDFRLTLIILLVMLTIKRLKGDSETSKFKLKNFSLSDDLKKIFIITNFIFLKTRKAKI